MKKVRTLADIKADPRVESIHSEDSGDYEKSWWCYLKAGWQWDNNEQHTIHERTIAEVCEELNTNVTEWPEDPDLEHNMEGYDIPAFAKKYAMDETLLTEAVDLLSSRFNIQRARVPSAFHC